MIQEEDSEALPTRKVATSNGFRPRKNSGESRQLLSAQGIRNPKMQQIDSNSTLVKKNSNQYIFGGQATRNLGINNAGRLSQAQSQQMLTPAKSLQNQRFNLNIPASTSNQNAGAYNFYNLPSSTRNHINLPKPLTGVLLNHTPQPKQSLLKKFPTNNYTRTSFKDGSNIPPTTNQHHLVVPPNLNMMISSPNFKAVPKPPPTVQTLLNSSPSRSSLKNSIILPYHSEQQQTDSPLRKKAYNVKIDMDVDEKQPVFSQQDVEEIFLAKILDLGIQYFHNQATRFHEFCEKYCINRKVNLSDQKLGKKATEAITQILLRVEGFSPIGKVCLSKNQIGDTGALMFAEVLSSTQSLVQLDLSSNSISTTGGAALISSLETNNSLLNLNLSSYEGLSRNTLGPNGVKPLKFVLKINSYLAILSLAGNFIGDTGVGYLCEGLEGNTTLMELNLAQNEITSEGVEIMEKGFKHTEIQILNLTRNPIKNKGAKSIANMIMRGSDVKIDDLNLTECQITYQGAVSIFLSLKRSYELTKLTLDGNNLHNKYMAELSQGIWSNTSLLKLSMANCQLFDNGCDYLMDGIERNQKIEEINLRNNNLRHASAKRISEILMSPANVLSTLILSENFLGDEGGKLIANALTYNRRIVKLDLQDNALQDESAKALAQILAKNSKLHIVKIADNNCGLNLVSKIQDLEKKNANKARRNLVPKHEREIRILRSRAYRIDEVAQELEQHSVIKQQLEDRYQKLDDRFNTMQRKSMDQQTRLTEAYEEYANDIHQLDNELETIEDMYKRRHNGLDKQFQEISRKHKRELKERELVQELIQGATEHKRLKQYKLKEESSQLQQRLTELQTQEKVAEVTYKIMLKEVLQYRPAYPTDLVQIVEEKQFSYPQPGDFGEVEYYRDFNFTSSKKESKPNKSKKNATSKKGKK